MMSNTQQTDISLLLRLCIWSLLRFLQSFTSYFHKCRKKPCLQKLYTLQVKPSIQIRPKKENCRDCFFIHPMVKKHRHDLKKN